MTAIEAEQRDEPEPVEQVNLNGALRRIAYAAEADPLFFKWQRGEASESEWLAKIAEIKERLPMEPT